MITSYSRALQANDARADYAGAWTIWFTGLSGSGKSTQALLLAHYLRRLSIPHEVIDGDEIRQDFCSDLGFSKGDRSENTGRIGYLARLLNRHNVVAIVAAISPYREAREEVRRKIPRFIEAHVDCSLQILLDRDVKGLYKRALAGEIACFSGISDPYEAPLSPEIYVNSGLQPKEDSTALVTAKLRDLGWLPKSEVGHLTTARSSDLAFDPRSGI